MNAIDLDAGEQSISSIPFSRSRRSTNSETYMKRCHQIATEHSDALVFATGDLANKEIFPALHSMVRRGYLDIPAIGVAKSRWNLDHCLRSRNYVNVIFAGKQPAPQWLNKDQAVKHCTAGIGIWQWANNDRASEPDVVMGLFR